MLSPLAIPYKTKTISLIFNKWFCYIFRQCLRISFIKYVAFFGGGGGKFYKVFYAGNLKIYVFEIEHVIFFQFVTNVFRYI